MKSFKNKLWMISGIMLIIIGITCFFLFHDSIESTAGYIGAALIAVSVVNIIYMLDAENRIPGMGWVLFDTIIDIVLGVYLLSSDKLNVLVKLIPYIFALFIISKGIAAIIDSNQSRMVLYRYWYINLIIGIIAIIYGLICCIYPIVASMSIGIACGIALIVSGIVTLAMWLFELKFRKQIQKLIGIYGSDVGRFKNEHPEEFKKLEAMIDV